MSDIRTPDGQSSAVARLVKRLLLYRFWRARILAWLGQRPLVLRAAKRFAPPSLLDQTFSFPDLSGGRHLVGQDLATVPVVLFVCLEWDEPSLDELATRLVELQQLTASFRPVFVVDQPHFEPLRRHEFVFETVLGRLAWDRFRDPTDWTDYLQGRVDAIVSDLGVTSVVPLCPQQVPDLRTDFIHACITRLR